MICIKKIKNLMDYPKDDYEARNPKKNNQRKSKYEELEEDDE